MNRSDKLSDKLIASIVLTGDRELTVLAIMTMVFRPTGLSHRETKCCHDDGALVGWWRIW
ncbi:MAG: hypothetical protein R3E01_06250 [Pirellulaceae bacterium]